jgi:hypothetical protein
MGQKGNVYRLLVGKPEGKRPLGSQDGGAWITLRWIFQKKDGVVWTGLAWLRIGTSGELL